MIRTQDSSPSTSPRFHLNAKGSDVAKQTVLWPTRVQTSVRLKIVFYDTVSFIKMFLTFYIFCVRAFSILPDPSTIDFCELISEKNLK